MGTREIYRFATSSFFNVMERIVPLWYLGPINARIYPDSSGELCARCLKFPRKLASRRIVKPGDAKWTIFLA